MWLSMWFKQVTCLISGKCGTESVGMDHRNCQRHSMQQHCSTTPRPATCFWVCCVSLLAAKELCLHFAMLTQSHVLLRQRMAQVHILYSCRPNLFFFSRRSGAHWSLPGKGSQMRSGVGKEKAKVEQAQTSNKSQHLRLYKASPKLPMGFPTSWDSWAFRMNWQAKG